MSLRSPRRRHLIGALLWLPGTVALPAAPSPNARQGAKRSAERAWVERAAALALAAKRNVGVAEFRRDIVAQREALRKIVLARPNPPEQLLKLHRILVLTNALLHAAAECHVAGRIVCPADLMQHIEDQVRNGLEQLHALEAVDRPSAGEARRAPA